MLLCLLVALVGLVVGVPMNNASYYGLIAVLRQVQIRTIDINDTYGLRFRPDCPRNESAPVVNCDADGIVREL